VKLSNNTTKDNKRLSSNHQTTTKTYSPLSWISHNLLKNRTFKYFKNLIVIGWATFLPPLEQKCICKHLTGKLCCFKLQHNLITNVTGRHQSPKQKLKSVTVWHCNSQHCSSLWHPQVIVRDGDGFQIRIRIRRNLALFRKSEIH